MKQVSLLIICQRNLQVLEIEIYKVKNYLGPKINKDIFLFVPKPNDLKNDSTLQGKETPQYTLEQKVSSLQSLTRLKTRSH